MKKIFLIIGFLLIIVLSRAQDFKSNFWGNKDIKPQSGVNLKTMPFTGCNTSPVVGGVYTADLFAFGVNFDMYQVGFANNSVSFNPITFGANYCYINANTTLVDANDITINKINYLIGINLSAGLQSTIINIANGTGGTLNKTSVVGGLILGTGNIFAGAGYDFNNKCADIYIGWHVPIMNLPLSHLVCLH